MCKFYLREGGKKKPIHFYEHIGFSGDFESKGTYSETTSNEISAETSL